MYGRREMMSTDPEFYRRYLVNGDYPGAYLHLHAPAMNEFARLEYLFIHMVEGGDRSYLIAISPKYHTVEILSPWLLHHRTVLEVFEDINNWLIDILGSLEPPTWRYKYRENCPQTHRIRESNCYVIFFARCLATYQPLAKDTVLLDTSSCSLRYEGRASAAEKNPEIEAQQYWREKQIKGEKQMKLVLAADIINYVQPREEAGDDIPIRGWWFPRPPFRRGSRRDREDYVQDRHTTQGVYHSRTGRPSKSEPLYRVMKMDAHRHSMQTRAMKRALWRLRSRKGKYDEVVHYDEQTPEGQEIEDRENKDRLLAKCVGKTFRDANGVERQRYPDCFAWHQDANRTAESMIEFMEARDCEIEWIRERRAGCDIRRWIR
jgi:hypothetical protein